jgi:hypothetical protein
MQRRYEAKEYLSKEGRVMTPNRFKTGEASPFVGRLYAAGALSVIVTGVDNFKSEDEMCADQMIVKLPKEKEKRAALFEIYNQELEKEGFDPEVDENQAELAFWWD